MDVKIYRMKQEGNDLAKFLVDSNWLGSIPMNEYELLTELKDIDKQEKYMKEYDEVQGPLERLFIIVPLQVTDIVVLTNTTWEGTYFCRSFGWFVLNRYKFNIESNELVSSIITREML